MKKLSRYLLPIVVIALGSTWCNGVQKKSAPGQSKLEEADWNKNIESLDGLTAKLFRLEKRLDGRVLAEFLEEIASVEGSVKKRDEMGRDFVRAVNIVTYVDDVKDAARKKLISALTKMKNTLADLRSAKTWTSLIGKAKKYNPLESVSTPSGKKATVLEKRVNEIITNFNDLFKSLRVLSVQF